jgi:putative flippase GtrA
MHDMTAFPNAPGLATPAPQTPAMAAWPLAARLGPERVRLVAELLRFGVVGVAGFVVDASVLTVAIALGLGPWFGRVLSYLAAATTTFLLNRAWTFRDAERSQPVRQWLLFLLVNLVGFACNYGTYAALISFVPVVAAHPVLGVAAGSLAGLMGNFVLARHFVFSQGGARRPSKS